MVAPTTLQISSFLYTNFVAYSFTLVLYLLYYYNNIPPVETGIESKKSRTHPDQILDQFHLLQQQTDDHEASVVPQLLHHHVRPAAMQGAAN